MPRRSRTAHAAQPVWWGLLGTIAVVALAAAPAHAGAPSRAAPATVTYPTGEWKIVVPPGMDSMPIVAIGGKGGDGWLRSQGGFGARVAWTMPVSTGEVYYLVVGGNGAGWDPRARNSGGGGGGGGATDIRRKPTSAGLADDTRIIVAGGGGGGGRALAESHGGNAGSAGADAPAVPGNPGPPTATGGKAGIPEGTGAGGTYSPLPDDVSRQGQAGAAGPRRPRRLRRPGVGERGRIQRRRPRRRGMGRTAASRWRWWRWRLPRRRWRRQLPTRNHRRRRGRRRFQPASGRRDEDHRRDGTAAAPGHLSRQRGPHRDAGRDAAVDQWRIHLPWHGGYAAGRRTGPRDGLQGPGAGDGVVQGAVAVWPDAGGAWSANTVSGFPDGHYTFVVRQSDAAGNNAESTATFATDTRAPVVDLEHLGATRFKTVTLTGARGSSPADTQQLTFDFYAGDTATGNPVLTVPYSSPDVDFEYTPTLADGTYAAQVTQVDTYGRVGKSAVRTFTIDSTSPSVALDELSSGAERRPFFSGTAGRATGDVGKVTLKVYAGNTATGDPTQTIEADPSTTTGEFFTRATTSLADGTYTVQATQVDDVDNAGRSVARTFVVGTPASPTPAGPSPSTPEAPAGRHRRPQRPPSNPTAAPGNRAPLLANVSLSAKRLTRKAITLRYKLNEAARVKIVVKQGRKTIGTLTRAAKTGANTLKLTKKIGRKTLKRGRTTLTITATDAAGAKSAAKTVTFTVR